MKTGTTLVFVLAGLIAGCAVGPDYHPPKTQAPANWSEAQLGGTTNATVTMITWWKSFHDPELNSLIERAVLTNYDVRIADGRLRQARALRSGVASDLGPTIDGSAGYTEARQSMHSIHLHSGLWQRCCHQQ